MSWINYHTHCNYCDGIGDPEEYVVEAVRLGLSSLGFSSHAPQPFGADWCMKQKLLPGYVAEINRLKEIYRDRIDIFLGLEVDYIPGVIGPYHETLIGIGLDYRIGSVHFAGEFPDGRHWTVDDSRVFSAGFREIHDDDPRKLVAEYYRRVCRMVGEQCPDIIGHLDLVKLNNRDGLYFNETEAWYREEVYRTLEVIVNTGAIIEVNLGAMNKDKLTVPFPSAWILERILQLGIPITISSDAHLPTNVAGNFDYGARLLCEIGFRELSILTNQGWTAVQFTPDGLR